MKKLFLLVLSLSLLPFMGYSQGNPNWDNIPDDIKNSKPFKRFEWFYQQRAFPYDQIPYDKYAQVVHEERIDMINKNTCRNADLEWTSVGPNGMHALPTVEHWGIVAGRVRAIAVHPDDPLTVYIGAACGGIWKTTDGGENWIDLGTQLESQSYGAIAIDPDNTDIVYVGSGEVTSISGFIVYPGSGLFKSSDGGQSWDAITNGFGDMTHFSDLVVSPFNSNLLFAALASGSCFAGDNMDNEGIWKSVDGGTTWTRTLDLQDAYDVAIHPTDENLVYAAIGGMSENAGFYISYDKGNTWNQNDSGLQAANTISRIQFDISQSNPQVIYTVVYQVGEGAFWTGTSRAYKSIDGGINWIQISEGINLGGLYNIWMDQGSYDLCIAIDPVDSDHVFIGNIELHETTNGSVFSPVRPFGTNANGSLVHPDYHKFAFAPSDPDYFYIACDGGIYKSTDAGQTATSLNLGLETIQFYRIASHPTNPDIVMGGMQDNGNGITLNSGESWQMTTDRDGMECFFDHTAPNIVYASNQNGRLTKSTDGGLTFSFIKNVSGAWITPFFMHPTNHMILYAASEHMFRSTNGGMNWTTIAWDIAPIDISTMAQSGVDTNNMIFATGLGNFSGDTIFIIKVSTDEGLTWTDVTENIPGEVRWISRVATDPADANTMYVLRTGFSEANKVWKTTDLGVTWTNISGDLPDLPCSDLFIDPENTDHIYVANDIGVYLTTDGGTTWEYARNGMPFVPVMDFDYMKIGEVKYLRAGTHGRSIYQTNIVGVGIEEPHFTPMAKNEDIKISIHPNPFSHNTAIEYILPWDSQLTMELFSIHGVKISTLADEFQQQGMHKVVFDGIELPSGIYFCVLKTSHQTTTKKMILMK